MARNAEVVRQWTILREIERSRSSGVTIDDLATLCDVTTRTIRRDLQALEEAGFPVYDDRSHDDGRTRWRLNGQALRGLAAGLTVSELCALYFSRTLLESLVGTPFRADLESAFDKLGAALTPHMQRFLDQLPSVIATKADLARPVDLADRQPLVAKALEATIQHRQARITYHSTSSDRTKVYLVHPYRLAYAQGALYLLAFVPEYGEVRTFAVDRLQNVSLLEERFVPADDVPDGAFAHSLGVHSGPPEHVEVDFAPSAARYIRSREWHPSQRLDDLPDGGVRLTLEVCVDRALRQWVLGFGAAARVASPASLAAELASEHDRAHAQYPGWTPSAMTGDIQLIAVDIDGTLLDSTGAIPPAHREALAEAHARSIQIALATGRALHFARPVAVRLGVPVALIVNNGALARTPEGRTALRRVVDRDVARAVLEAGRGLEDSVALLFDREDDRQLVFEHMDWSHPNRAGYYARNKAFMSRGSLDAALRGGDDRRQARGVWTGSIVVDGLPADDVSAGDLPGGKINDPPLQVMFNGGVAAMRRLAADLRGLAIAERFTVAITEYEARDFALVDINGPGCSKGSTLERYADQCGIAREHVMAVGDNLNDLEMLEFAGWPVVMGNASDDIKRRGFPVVPSHDDDGLAVAIERFVFGRPDSQPAG